eukprot:7394082-Prorocentrum_lima.AAC.1
MTEGADSTQANCGPGCVEVTQSGSHDPNCHSATPGHPTRPTILPAPLSSTAARPHGGMAPGGQDILDTGDG